MQKNISNFYIMLVVLIILSTIYTTAKSLLSTPFTIDSYRNNYFSEYDTKIEVIKKMIPVNTTMGYITNNNDAIGLQNFHELQKFYLMQYSLVPNHLVKSTKQEYVIGNLSNWEIYTPKYHLKLVKDFNNGIMLFKQNNFQ